MVLLKRRHKANPEDPSGEQFTVTCFEQYLTDENHPSARSSPRVDRFSDGVPQADDRTMLTIDPFWSEIRERDT